MFKPLAENPLKTISVCFDGLDFRVPSNISVAAALLMLTDTVRYTPVSASPRGPYCMMGICFDCLVTIDGKSNLQSCQVQVREGMQIESQRGAPEMKTSP